MAQETVFVEIIKHSRVFEPGTILELTSQAIEVAPALGGYLLPDMGNGEAGLLPMQFLKKIKIPKETEPYFGKCVLTSVTNFARNDQEDPSIDTENIGSIKPEKVRVIHYPDCQQIVFHMPKYAYHAGHFTLINHVSHEVEKTAVKNKLNGGMMISIDTLPLKPGFYTIEADWPGGWTHKIRFIKFRQGFPTAAYPNPPVNIRQAIRNQEVHLPPPPTVISPVQETSRLIVEKPFDGYEHPPGNVRMVQYDKEHRLFDSNHVEIQNGTDLQRFKTDLTSKFGPAVEYTQDGRGGTITYREKEINIAFEWEFGGGKAVVVILIPEEKYWENHTKTPLSRRAEILNFVSKKVIEDRAPGCDYEVYSNTISILRR
ncbi:hypothetical protein [Dyadobacter sp. CY323]|uniref:hypothetical protein n=1 Tax=Dyadobacter sp. CY323 TaxID=2907302 RepID=UPI001F1EAD9D|nr:hypothetical protein [Dyadobacter sp. CY323]MCE6989950.1 hypothetical protein [Dyadobacter sp. CY323]